MQQPSSEGKFWLALAAVTFVILVIAAIRWSLAHPFGIHWDESLYLNDIEIDTERLRAGLLLKLGGRLLIKTYGRPPAFRLMAIPLLALTGFKTTFARLLSITWFGLSAWFVYLAARRISSSVAGGFAVLVFILCPEVISASIFFGTETPLYLATSAMLFFLFECWSSPSPVSKAWIPLGLAIALGFLSKASFAAIALPVLAFWFIANRWGKFGVPSPAPLAKAMALALLLAGPWWLFNIKDALAYSQYARGFVRNSLGTPSLATWAQWFNTVFQSLLGIGVSLVVLLVLVSFFRTVVLNKEKILSPLQKAALGASACAGVPILLAQLSGTNHLLRHITPAVIPLAVVIGVLADRTGWARFDLPSLLTCLLFTGQLVMILVPVAFPNDQTVDIGFVNGALPWRVMAQFDQWDWRPLQHFADNCGLKAPKVSYLGNGRGLNPPAIRYPWVARAASVRADTLELSEVTWLWRYEDGPPNWYNIMETVEKSDVVLTAPHFIGEARFKENEDNQYNAEFSDRLSRNQDFRGPLRFEMGRFRPVEVDVFVKNSSRCKAEPSALVNH